MAGLARVPGDRVTDPVRVQSDPVMIDTVSAPGHHRAYERGVTTVLRRSWLRAAAPLTAVILAGALVGTSSPAQAAATDPDATAAPAAAGSTPITVRLATTEQIRAMAAQGKGQLITFQGSAAKTPNLRDGGLIAPPTTMSCLLFIGLPFYAGAWNSPVIVDGFIACDDYVQLASLTVELYRVPYRVAHTSASFPYTFGIYATAGVSTCTNGVYFGYATTTLVRFGMNPPSITDSVIGLPVYISCTPPPPPGPGIPTPPNCQANPSLCARHTPGVLPTERRRRRRAPESADV